MEYIKNRFYEKGIQYAAEYQKLKKDHGNKVVTQLTLGQILSGQKGIPALICDTSDLDPVDGVRIRGYSLPELQEKLPKVVPQGEPLPEGAFYLMLIGEIPSYEDAMNLSRDWVTRSYVPQHTFDVLDALPRTARPMTYFSTAILSMATESVFQKAYRAGVHKKFYWDFMYEDAMNLIARLPRVAAYIYRKLYHNDHHIDPNPKLDWAGNFAYMMGYDIYEVMRLMRLYMVVHADHEGGNVTAHTVHLVGSALSNAYYSLSAGMNGLAGPLHGFANQEVLNWLTEMTKEIGTDEPTDEQIATYIKKTIEEGRVVPGYGHAVLRVTDPRFTIQQKFAEKYIANDKVINLVNAVYRVAPPVLQATGKVRNPYPNVDAISGALLNHYGITEHNFYTVMFGVSRSLGVLAQLILDRMLGMPIERPDSYTLDHYKKIAEGIICIKG